MTYLTQIATTVAGIPAIIAVLDYTHVCGSFSPRAASDMDYFGYLEMDWQVCDRRGRPAPWLERKLDQHERDRIDQEVIDHMHDLASLG
jgi:hypothetical protein